MILKILNRIGYRIINRISIKDKEERKALNDLGPPFENMPKPKVWTDWDQFKYELSRDFTDLFDE